jgi:hypothetical protein
MPTVPVTTDQLTQLQNLVGTLVADKTTADNATTASNNAHAALTSAQAAAANADTAEAAADGVVNVDLANLKAYIDGLVPPAPPPPTTPPAGPQKAHPA